MLSDLVKIMSVCNRNVFPVIDKEENYLGEIRVEEVRNIMFRPELYQRFNMQKLMVSPRERVDVNDSMEVVMKKFEQSNAWNLPVLDGKKYVGYVSKSKIFSAYRSVLVEFSDE
jgi:CIC family chloride channel protein